MSVDEISSRLDELNAKIDKLIDIVLGRAPDEERRKTMDAMLDMLQRREDAAYMGAPADLPYTKAEAEELYEEAAAKAEKEELSGKASS